MVDSVNASNLPRKARYDLEDVADLVIELHNCVHQVGNELKDHRQEVTEQFGDVRERVARIEGRQEAIGQRIGVEDDKLEQKPAWFPKPWQMAGGVCAAAGGFVVLYQIAAPVLVALNHAILAHH